MTRRLKQRSGRYRSANTRVSDDYFDLLEPRLFFSAPFAGVGFHFDTAHPYVYAATGDRADDGSVSGSLTRAEVGPPSVRGPLPWATFDLMSHGRLTSTPANGAAPFDTQAGAVYASSMGFPAGFLAGRTGSSDDMTYLVERQDTAPVIWDGSGGTAFKLLTLDSTGVSIVSGRFFVDPGTGSIRWILDGGDGQGVGITITSRDNDGTLHLANGYVIYTSASGSFLAGSQGQTLSTPGGTALIADLDGTDGSVSIGVGYHFVSSQVLSSEGGLNGVFGATIATPNADAGAFFSATQTDENVFVSSVVLNLDPQGAYRMYNLADYDLGGRTVISSGTWDLNFQSIAPPTMGVIVDRNTIRLLQAGTGRAAGLAISPDYALLPFAVVSADGTSLELVSGLATRLVALPTEITTRAATVSLDANGHPIFYEFDRASASDFDDTNRAWFSVDLIDRAGGKPLSAVHAVNYGGARGPFYMVAGIATDGDAVAWERDVNGVWTFRNVTQELARDPLNTALSTVFEITAVHSGGDAQFTGIAIAGMNGRGEVVLYNIDGGRNNFGVLDWFFANISTDQLAPFGAPTPAWTSDVTGYATTWSGVDIVGHDAAGHLQVIWTAPDLHRWFQDDLTDNSGGPATSGAISVVVAPWNTIHIHSLDSSGNLIVTWWDPAFGSHWAVDNLTQETGGPALVSSRGFASFLGVDNSLNIAAHDTSGFIRVYWWRPDQQRWRAGTASSAIDPIQPVTITAGDVAPADDPAHTRPTGSVQSIYGRATNGHFVRLLLVHLRSRQPAR